MALRLFKTIEQASKLVTRFPAQVPARLRSPDPAGDELLEAGLLLALEAADGASVDFLWCRNPDSGAISVWHPDPPTMQRLDIAHLTGVLQALLSDTSSHSPGAPLARAVSQGQPIKNLEVSWLDGSDEIWWQISTGTVPVRAGVNPVTIGIVRDISPAHKFCASLVENEIRHLRGLRAGQQLATILVSSLRQNINVVTNICDMLPENQCASSDGAPVRQENLAGDIRTAVNDLLTTASLARDYANAHVGSLAMNLQTQNFIDVFRFATSGLSALTQQFGIDTTISCPQRTCLVRADPDRLRTVLHVLTFMAVSKAKAASTVCIEAIGDAMQLEIIRISYTGQEPATETCIEEFNPTMGMLDPGLAREFMDQVITGHGAKLEFASTGKTAHSIDLSLPRLNAQTG